MNLSTVNNLAASFKLARVDEKLVNTIFEYITQRYNVFNDIGRISSPAECRAFLLQANLIIDCEGSYLIFNHRTNTTVDAHMLALNKGIMRHKEELKELAQAILRDNHLCYIIIKIPEKHRSLQRFVHELGAIYNGIHYMYNDMTNQWYKSECYLISKEE